MKYLLVEPKVRSKAPNIALMKWARWCDINGHEYIYVKGCVKLHSGFTMHVDAYTPDVILISMIFTYNSHVYEKTINYYIKKYPNAKIKVGGVFPTLYPKWFSVRWDGIEIHRGMCCEIEDISPKYDLDIMYENSNSIYDTLDTIILYASRGCTNKCAYCAVPQLEGSMHSFKSIKDTLTIAREEMPHARSVVLYDNNFTEHEYFDHIVDELVEFGLPIDIHGLHVQSFTEHHAKRLSELEWKSQSQHGNPYIRFSFDKVKYVDDLERAYKLFLKYKIKAEFFAYMLFNFMDRPEDFWWRIEQAQRIVIEHGGGMLLFPQRYEPFKSLERNKYIGRHWTEKMVRGLVRLYTNRLRGWFRVNQNGAIYDHVGYSLDEFLDNIKKAGEPDDSPAFYPTGFF